MVGNAFGLGESIPTARQRESRVSTACEKGPQDVWSLINKLVTNTVPRPKTEYCHNKEIHNRVLQQASESTDDMFNVLLGGAQAIQNAQNTLLFEGWERLVNHPQTVAVKPISMHPSI